jgi:hypothetical protein
VRYARPRRSPSHSPDECVSDVWEPDLHCLIGMTDVSVLQGGQDVSVQRINHYRWIIILHSAPRSPNVVLPMCGIRASDFTDCLRSC